MLPSLPSLPSRLDRGAPSASSAATGEHRQAGADEKHQRFKKNNNNVFSYIPKCHSLLGSLCCSPFTCPAFIVALLSCLRSALLERFVFFVPPHQLLSQPPRGNSCRCQSRSSSLFFCSGKIIFISALQNPNKIID